MSTWLEQWDRRYTDRVRLLVEILPVLAQEPGFALKGGTAINLFEHDLPRLSVDIDLAWLPLALGLGLLAWAGWKALAANLDRFVITNMRVFRVHGVLARSLATMPLGRILDITVIKPMTGRILGYGHFTFESAAQDQGLRDIRFVGRPDERDLAIQRVVQRAGLRGPRVN